MKIFRANNTDFATPANKQQTTTFLVLVLLALHLIYILYYLYVQLFIENPDSVRPKAHFWHVARELGLPEIAMAIVLAIIIAFLFTGIASRNKYASRDIVTGMVFNDQQQLLSINTQSIDGGELKKRTLPYKDVRIGQQVVGAPNSADGHPALTIVQNGTCIGYILKYHFTWDDATFAEISARLKPFRRA